MNCLDCDIDGVETPAVALCQSCHAGVCTKHAVVIDRPVTQIVPITKVVVLPRAARQITCRICRDALSEVKTAS